MAHKHRHGHPRAGRPAGKPVGKPVGKMDAVYRAAERAAWVTTLVNAIFGLAKLVIGATGNSLALVAESIHTLADAATSVAVWVGLSIARRPAAATHPYGHGKAEPISGKVVAIALFAVGGGIIYQSVMGIIAFLAGRAEPAEPTAWTLYAALVSVVVKELMYRYEAGVGRRVGSMALIADAWHSRSDALASVAVAMGIGAAKLGGPSWQWADEAAAIVVAVLVIWVAWDIFEQSAAVLMDTQVSPETREAIRDIARSVTGVRDVEKILARRSGLDILIDIHVEVDPDLTVNQGHSIATQVKNRLKKEMPQATYALVHIEPYYPGDHDTEIV